MCHPRPFSQNGEISYAEFKNNMLQFLSGSFGGRKRSSDGTLDTTVSVRYCRNRSIAEARRSPQSRRRIQSGIASFFTQFQMLDGEAALARAAEVATNMESATDLSEVDPVQSLLARQMNPAERVAKLADAEKACSAAGLAEIKAALSGTDVGQLVQAAQLVKRVVAVAQFFNTDRIGKTVANRISALYRAIWFAEIPALLVNALSPKLDLGSTPEASALHGSLLTAALEALYHCALGPRMAQVDASDPMHPNNVHTTTKALLVCKHIPGTSSTDPTGLVWAMWHLQHNPVAEVRAAAVKLIGAVAAFPFGNDNNSFRNALMAPSSAGGLDLPELCIAKLTDVAGKVEEPAVKAEILNTLSILLGKTHCRPGDVAVCSPEHVSMMGGLRLVEAVAAPLRNRAVASSADKAIVYMFACSALSYLLPFVDVQQVFPLLALLVELARAEAGEAGSTAGTVLGAANIMCAREALHAITVASCVPHGAEQLVDKAQLLTSVLVPILASTVDSSLKMAALAVLRSLMGSAPALATKLDGVPGLPDALVRCIEHDDITNARAIAVVRSMVSTGSNQDKLINAGAVRALSLALGRFQQHDSVMAEMYAFAGPTFNYEEASGALHALSGLFDKWPSSGASTARTMFGMELVQNAKAIFSSLLQHRRSSVLQCKSAGTLEALFQGKAADGSVNVMYEHAQDVMKALEGLVFQRVLPMHERDAGSNALSRSVATELKQLQTELGTATKQVQELFTKAFHALKMGGGLGGGAAAGAGGMTQGQLMSFAADNANSGLLSGEMHVPVQVVVQVANTQHKYVDEFIPQAINLYKLSGAVNAHFGTGNALVLAYPDPMTGAESLLQSDADLAAALQHTKQANQGTLRLTAHPPSGQQLNLVPLAGIALGDFNHVQSEFERRYAPGRLLDRKGFSQVYNAFKALKRAEMTEDEFVQAMQRQHIIKDQMVARTYFRAFDKDDSKTLSIEEAVLGLATLTTGSIRDRLRLAFEAFDSDGNGYVDELELARLVQFSTHLSDDMARTAASKLIQQVDANHDGRLDFAEFMQAAQMEPSIIATFNN